MNEDDVTGWREKLAAVQAQLDELFPAGAAEDADEAFAAAARKGVYGPEWQILQDRIDLGLTTRAAVLSGEDDSVQARAVREAGQRNSEALVASLRAGLPKGGPHDPVAELRALQQTTAERSARLTARLREMQEESPA
ncbi:MAG: hypothetical protein JST33_06955 [Actinobacteria bacterium]|nr:hypothetical protein [Actinomycetota bacterium]